MPTAPPCAIWWLLNPETPAEILEEHNREEAGARVCEKCNRFHPEAAETEARTMYTDAALNVSPFLCPACTLDHHAHWDEVWTEYNLGRL